MQYQKVFSSRFVLFISLISLVLLSLNFYIQYKNQLQVKSNEFNNIIKTQVEKNINKKIFEIEASITSLASFYQSSDDFTTSTFGYVSKDLIKNYPIIENIIYSQLVYEEDKTDFYQDMYTTGFFNFRIKSNYKNDYYIVVTDVAPDSYKYSKYYGYNILNNQSLDTFFKELSISTEIGYSHKKILEENRNLLHLSLATFYGTDIPEIKNREEQISGYFIISINLEALLESLREEFNSFSFSLEEQTHLEKNGALIFINKAEVNLPTSELESIFIYHPLFIDDFNIVKMFIYNFVLLLFITIIVYLIYNYRKHLLYEKFSHDQLHKSEKMASLGQMIGNISHQWRQPLSAISMLASSIQLNNTLNTLDKNDLDKAMKDIVNKTKYLSETINTFRDFIKEEKSIEEIYLEDRIKQSLNIVQLALLDHKIKLIDNINYENKLKIMMVIGELDQVIINIINNAKDALVEKKIKNPCITLNLLKSSSFVTIGIEDNAGGIPVDIIKKIFEPYFTTKHKTQGTGLGLHMSYRIITESLKGKLYVQNTKEGAKFFIEIPLDK
jgi:signal transduction histidine kinase